MTPVNSLRAIFSVRDTIQRISQIVLCVFGQITDQTNSYSGQLLIIILYHRYTDLSCIFHNFLKKDPNLQKGLLFALTRFQRFLYNAMLLTLTSLGMRGIGVLFNRYLTIRIGTSGLGQFSLMMSVYGFAVTVASAGIHLALTRVVSESCGCEDNTAVRQAVRTGFLCSLTFGLSSAALLLFAAPMIGSEWLGFPEAIPALRLLAMTLPFLSMSTMIGGYFVGVRQAYKGAVIGVLCQGIRIGCVVFLLRSWGAHSEVWPCYALVIGALASEIANFLLSFLLFIPDYRRRCAVCGTAAQKPSRDIPRYVLHIALPILLTACIRSGLMTLEHLLIPMGLQKSGEAADAAMAAYGTVHGVVLPILLFPAALLSSFSGLLIPEVSEFRAQGRQQTVCRTASRVLRITLCFSIFVSGSMICYADLLGDLFGDGTASGQYLRMLAALIPVMYLDTMVDAFLKSLDAQLDSMRYNLMDAAFCVVMAYLLLPRFGIAGYVLLLYASELFNLTLSLGKLISLIHLRIPLIGWVAKPILSVIGAMGMTQLFFRVTGMTYRFALTTLVVHLLICLIFYGCFLYLLGAVRTQDIITVRQLFFPVIKLPLAKTRKPWYNMENQKYKGRNHHDKRNQPASQRTPRHL